MKTSEVSIGFLLGSLALIFCTSSLAGRADELNSILKSLEETDQSDFTYEQSVQYRRETQQRLQRLVDANPNTEEALTAKLWLGTLQSDQTYALTERAKKRAALRAVYSLFDEVDRTAPNAWQGKLARLLKCSTLAEAGDWDRFRVEAADILSRIPDYVNETNQHYTAYMKTQGMNLSKLEPELRYLLIVAAACEGKTEEALRIARELQQKFPEWSERERIRGTIELLEAGKPAFGCP
jgi:hypothetical protein